MSQPRKYYWDSSVFITVLQKDKKYGVNTLAAAAEILRRVSVGDAVVISSTVVVTEVLPSHCTKEQYDQFLALLQSPFLSLRDADIAVCRKAAELRDACLVHKEGLRLQTPDALHIATCIIYEKDIDQIHSYDPHFPSKFKWLNLNGTPCHPYLDQTSMEAVWFEEESPPADEPTAELPEIDEAPSIAEQPESAASELPTKK